jgi:hypothetical protein
MITPIIKRSQLIKIIEAAKDQLRSMKGVCEVISLNKKDIMNIKSLERLDEQIGCKMVGRKYNTGIRKVLSSDVILSFMVNNEYDWPVNTIKFFHKGKMIGEDTQDKNIIKKFSERNDSFVMGNFIFYDKEALKNSNMDDPICMFIIELQCPQLDAIKGISEAVMGIPSRYTHNYLQLKICTDQKQILGSFLVGFNIDKMASAFLLRDDNYINANNKDEKCQLPL